MDPVLEVGFGRELRIGVLDLVWELAGVSDGLGGGLGASLGWAIDSIPVG